MFVLENLWGGFRMKKQLRLNGVIPAIILPLNPDYSIDEAGFRRHIKRVLGVKGVTGIVCNAHASEVTLLSREERKRVLQIVCEEVNGKVPVIAGAYGESTQTCHRVRPGCQKRGRGCHFNHAALQFYVGSDAVSRCDLRIFLGN